MQHKFSKKIVLWSVIVSTFFFGFGFLLNLYMQEEVVASPYNLTIVLDPGHGNPDGGSVGETTGITESELNLIYANKLEKLLKSVGIKVIKTRNTLNGLSLDNKNFKKADMQKRKLIIENSNAQAVVSIHMNKFSLKSENGAQVFYYEKSESGKKFAELVKDELVKQIDNARELVLGGDFFITKCIEAPSIIVECGFLSNPEEEIKLQQNDYQDKLCYSIFCGILKFFGSKNV